MASDVGAAASALSEMARMLIPPNRFSPPGLQLLLQARFLFHRSSSALMKGAVGDLARESWRTVPWAVMLPLISGIVRSSRLHCFKTIRQNAFADFRRAGAM